MAAADKPSDFKFLYPLDESIEDKIETIAVEIYGADGIEFSDLAKEQVELYTKLGFDGLPICMAKTHLSLSHDAIAQGCPQGFYGAHPGDPGLRRRRLPVSADRVHVDHARSAHPAGILRHRHRS